MSDYPRSWRRSDPDGAAAVLRAPCQPPQRPMGDGHELQIVGTVRGYPMQVSEWHVSHRHRIEAEFTVPPSWPLFTLIRDRGEERPLSSGEIKHDWFRLSDVAGYQLWTPDRAHTLELFGLGIAEVVARHQLERLRIGSAGSSFDSATGVRLNAETAQWTLDLIQALLIGAPPYADLGLVEMSPGIAWTQEHLDRNLARIKRPDEEA